MSHKFPASVSRFCEMMLILLVALTSPAIGQDDIFGTPLSGDPLFADPDPGTRTIESVKEGEVESSPLTRQLLMQASQGNRRLAASVSALSRTSKWTEVDLLLRSVTISKIPADVQADMATRIGPTQYLRIKSQESVSEQAKSVLSALAKAQNDRTRSPKRIAAAIKELKSESPDRRAAAARVLFAGGNASIGALADQLTSGNPITPVDDLLPTYVRFGDGVLRPLQRYALYGSAIRREKALTALARISPDSR